MKKINKRHFSDKIETNNHKVSGAERNNLLPKSNRQKRKLPLPENSLKATHNIEIDEKKHFHIKASNRKSTDCKSNEKVIKWMDSNLGEKNSRDHKLSRTKEMSKTNKRNIFMPPEVKSANLGLPTDTVKEDFDSMINSRTNGRSMVVPRPHKSKRSSYINIKDKRSGSRKHIKSESGHVKTVQKKFDSEATNNANDSVHYCETHNRVRETTPNEFEHDVDRPVRKKIRPASFVLKITTMSTESQTDITANNLSLLTSQIPENVRKFKIALGHDQFTERLDNKPVHDCKGNDLRDFFTCINDNISFEYKSGASNGENCFITLNSRFKVLRSMDMKHLELIPENVGETEVDPVRIYATLNKAHYKSHLDYSYWHSIPEFTVTRLFKSLNTLLKQEPTP